MGRPKPPDPMQTARQQQTFNQEAQQDAAQLGQPNQVTPWGNIGYSGEIGSPDRTQTVTLNPADQARLEQERSIKSRLLSMILGGAQGMNGQPVGGMQQAQGKQGQAQPMPAMNERFRSKPRPCHRAEMPQPEQPMMENPPFGPIGWRTPWATGTAVARRNDGGPWIPGNDPAVHEVDVNGSAAER